MKIGLSLSVTSPRGVIAGAVLDALSVQASAAYSLRRVRTAYTGAAIRVRRSSDNAEADIGFTPAGDLNTATLLAHCGSGSGLVTTWYDQSANNILTEPTGTTTGTTWGVNGATRSAAVVTDPFGGSAATLVTDDTSTGEHRIGVYGQAIPLNSSTTYTGSIYVRAGTLTRGDIGLLNGVNWATNRFTTFDLTAGTVTGAGSAIENLGGGWFRVSITSTTVSGAVTTTGLQVRMMDAGGNIVYTGTGSGTMNFYGGQVEVGQRTAFSPRGQRNEVQTAAPNQPRIVNAGVLELAGNRPALFTQAGLSISNAGAWLVTGNADRALNAVMTRQSTGNMSVWSGAHSANGAFGIDLASANSFVPYTFGAGDIISAPVSNTITVATASRAGGTSSGFINGSARPTNSSAIATVASPGIGIGVRPDAAVSTGWYSEVVYFASALSTTDRQTLERNQGAYYGVSVQ